MGPASLTPWYVGFSFRQSRSRPSFTPLCPLLVSILSRSCSVKYLSSSRLDFLHLGRSAGTCFLCKIRRTHHTSVYICEIEYLDPASKSACYLCPLISIDLEYLRNQLVFSRLYQFSHLFHNKPPIRTTDP
ncbi:hypothetical protein GE21DRAFT_1222281 [Neurospora crassa]|nr:related to finger protein YJL206c [imported] - Neurospora crassa [Neurospora crassa]KHE78862.1 hypothetical protein GE21DRAFT_1222281 [Neurospora crassa]